MTRNTEILCDLQLSEYIAYRSIITVDQTSKCTTKNDYHKIRERKKESELLLLFFLVSDSCGVLLDEVR